MADYSRSKSGPGAMFPDNAVETTWNRLEPLVTPTQVKNRHLFGIPLVSAIRDPLTNRAQRYDDDLIKDTIDRAVGLVETETGLDIFPVRMKEKLPFDQHHYQSFGYMRVARRPVACVDKITITPASGNDLYTVPIEWVETANLPYGQLNLTPISGATVYGDVTGGVAPGGALFLNVLGQHRWVPAFWMVEYTSGFPDGLLPRVVNELVGAVAAMEVLSALAATYARSTSHSLGIDGLSQSVSTPGPQLFKQRLDELAEKRKKLVKKLRTQYALNLFSGEV